MHTIYQAEVEMTRMLKPRVNKVSRSITSSWAIAKFAVYNFSLRPIYCPPIPSPLREGSVMFLTVCLLPTQRNRHWEERQVTRSKISLKEIFIDYFVVVYCFAWHVGYHMYRTWCTGTAPQFSYRLELQWRSQCPRRSAYGLRTCLYGVYILRHFWLWWPQTLLTNQK